MRVCMQGPTTCLNTWLPAKCKGSVLQAKRRCKSSHRLNQSSRLDQRCTRCCAQQDGQSRQYETELFQKLFGTPPPPKQDSAGGGGGDEPPAGGQVMEEEEEPDEEQVSSGKIQRAKQQARQQALFNFITVSLCVGTLASLSTWEPYFLYLGRVWSFVHLGNQAQAYTELTTEAIAWGLLLTMGWPWNLLIYPTHLTRMELTNARKDRRGPIFKNILSSVYNPFARRKRAPPSAASQ